MKRSLRSKFLLFISAGFLLTALGTYLTFQCLLNQIIIKLGTRFAEKQVLYDKERSLGPILREIAIAQKLATSNAIIAWTRSENNPEIRKRGIEELESFRTAFADKSYFLAMKKSRNYYYNDAKNAYKGKEKRYMLQESDPEDQWFFRTLGQAEQCLLNVDHDEKIGVTKVWINCVVKDNANPVAVIGTGIDLSSFIKNIVDLPQEGVRNIFIDSSGAIQAHRKKEMIDFRSISKNLSERKTIFQILDSDHEKEKFKNLMHALKQSKHQVKTLFVHINQTRYLAGISYLKEFDWYNVTLMEIPVLVGKQFFTPFFFLVAGSLIIILLLFSFLFKVLALNKLEKLDLSVRQFGEGNFQFDPGIKGSDEISRLADQFKQMADKIQDHTHNLEEKVAERTRDLKTANDTKDTFFSILAHDLRGPIGNLSTMLDNVLEPGKPLSSEDNHLLKHAIDGVYQLLEELMSWSLSQRGLLTPELKPCFLMDTLKKCISILQQQAQDKNISTEITGETDTMVCADPGMLMTVLRNLYSNAIKFTPSGGKITFKLEKLSASFQIQICDSGIGMSQDKIQKLFMLGEKNISTRGTADESGKGFGLILCKEFIELQGGEIGVNSSPGQGSCFWFTLPHKQCENL